MLILSDHTRWRRLQVRRQGIVAFERPGILKRSRHDASFWPISSCHWVDTCSASTPYHITPLKGILRPTREGGWTSTSYPRIFSGLPDSTTMCLARKWLRGTIQVHLGRRKSLPNSTDYDLIRSYSYPPIQSTKRKRHYR